MQTVKSYCRNCTHMCGLELDVDDNKIVQWRGDKSNPVTVGYSCIKADMSTEVQNGSGRLEESLARQSDGSFAPIDNQQAMDEIADKLRAIIDQYGPESVALYTGTGAVFSSLAYPLCKALLAAIGSKNFFSSMTVDQSAQWVTLSRMGFMASGKPVPTQVKTLLLAGNNPSQAHSLNVVKPFAALLEFQKNGGNLIVIDPRASEIVRGNAKHLAVKPGEDATLFAGMIRLILENGWQDTEFCDAYVEGLDKLRKAVAPYTPEYVEQRAGIPAEQLYETTELFATSESSMAYGTTGVCMGPHSNLTHHLMECLNALCGNYMRAGDVLTNPGSFAPRKRLAETVVPPRRTWETGVKCHGTDTGLLLDEMPTAAIPDAITTPGDGKMRALICFGGNPAKAIGQPEKTVDAFQQLDLMVTIDQRMTDTAELSHYVIAPTMPYERYDLSTYTDIMSFSEQPYVQCAKPVLEPPAGTIKETEFFWGLAKRLNKQLIYKKLTFAKGFDRVRDGIELDMQTPPDDETLMRFWCKDTAIDFDELMASDLGVFVKQEGVTVAAVERTPDSHRLQVCPEDVAEEIAVVRAEAIDDDGYQYRLITRRLIGTMNSAYHDTERAKQRYPVNYAYMNPEDIEAEGLEKGIKVKIASAHGEIETPVHPDKNLRRGVISVAHLWGKLPIKGAQDRRGAFTGNLVSIEENIEPINRMPIQTAIPVNLQRV